MIQRVSDYSLKEMNNNSFDINAIKAAMERFILQTDITPSSRLTYKRSLKRFILWLEEISKKNQFIVLSRQTILDYKHFLDEGSLKPFTKSLYLVAIRQFFAWTESVLLYPNIGKGVRGFKRLSRAHHKDSLSVEGITKLFIYLKNQKHILVGLRDYVLLLLLVHTGMRLIEIRTIRLEDIEKSGKDFIVWIRGKGRSGKDAFVVIMEDIYVAMQEYLTARSNRGETLEPTSLLIVAHGTNTDNNYKKKMPLSTPSISRMIRLCMVKAGIKTKRISAHSLRHTFGVMAIKAGASLYEVQLAMRHSSSNTTQIYTADIEQMKRMEASPENKVFDILKNIT